MAAIEEKLLKSLEYLRNTDYNSGDVFQRNKEKIQNCVYIVDTLTSHTTKVLPNFQHLLSTTFETLFLLCNDNESDLRLIAEESLNKIIKATDSENVNRVLMELHKELKKNGPVRSLRAALLRFANMAHLIRLPKRKQYLISMMPCVVSISERNDDIIHEALMKCLPKILKSLGNFLSETDVKTLLNTFLSNIGNSSPIIRRANANCLLAVCLNCRKPYQLLSHLLDTLLDLVTASGENQITVFTVLGVLSCLKLHLPYMKKMENIQEIQGSFGITKKTNVMQVGDDKFIQVYQMCLHFLLFRDDSVMSGALDTLNTLLQNCTPEIKTILLAGDGIKSRRLLFPSHLLIKPATSQSIESRSSPTDNFQQTFTRRNPSQLDGILRVGDDVTAVTCAQAKDVDVGCYDDRDVPLLYCTRLLCKTCILLGRPDSLIPDAIVRISVKNLALTCLSSLFSMYPSSFVLYLDKNDPLSAIHDRDDRTGQAISDIMLLADHPDPQLRGAVRYAVASYLKSALAESNGRYEEWCANMLADRPARSDVFALENIIAFIKEGLLDDSSNCVRQVLSSATICLETMILFHSTTPHLVLPLLELLPAVSKHSHWLIKVKLLDVIVKLPFLSIDSIAGDLGFQNKIVFDVVLVLLTDEDRRVRTAAVDTLIKIIPLLYTERRRKSMQREAVERIRMYFRDGSLNSSFERGEEDEEIVRSSKSGGDSDVPFPFDALLDGGYPKADGADSFVDTLSTVMSILCRRLKENFTDNTIIIIGYIEALAGLSLTYPTTVYGELWDINETTPSNLESFVRSLFENELIYDIHFHIHVLRLYGNLLAGMYVRDLYGIIETTTTKNVATTKRTTIAARELFLNHTMKLLNMFVHLAQDTLPPVTAESKASAAAAASTVSVAAPPGSSSPLKAVIRKSSDAVVVSINDRRTDDADEKSTSTAAAEKKHHESTTKATTTMALGYFSNSAHYVKIYSRLKIAYAKYKTTLNYDDEPEDIITFLRTLLECLCQMLEITGVAETSKIAEEILSYMQSIFHLEPTRTITCVHQLLKSLFGSNLASRSDVIRLIKERRIQEINENQDIDDSDRDNLYYVLSRYHFEDVLNHFETIRFKCSTKTDNENGSPSSALTSSYSRRKDKRQTVTPNKSDKMLANYIRLFEPMVIGSLKHYTITSDVQVQCAVLRLLNQLVRLKVNYCLLDSEQVFIKFIQKQFEYIEEGLVTNPEKLIPNMFDFLTSLSHGKQHSKSIIGVPKIIQLCDGLMASEQSPLTCCIPALRPIVEDVFLTRCVATAAVATGELDELEIAREVLLSMLLRLFEYAEVLDLLRIILDDARRTAVDRWSKWSKQMLDVFLAKLTDRKLRLDNGKDVLAIMRWLVALHPIVFRSLPINELLAILFRRFPIKENNIVMISRWLGKVIVILTIVVQLNETELLRAARDSLTNFSPEGTFDRISDRIKSDPLNVTKTANYLEGFNVDGVFAKFIFRVLEFASARCALAARQSQDTDFLVEQLSHLLFVCREIYQSDNYPVLLATTIDLIVGVDEDPKTKSPYRNMLEGIDDHIFEMGRTFPTLIYQWCAIRNIFKTEERSSSVDETTSERYLLKEKNLQKSVVNMKNQLYSALSTSAVLFSYSEYLIDNTVITDGTLRTDSLTKFIEANVYFIVLYCDEPPVAELILIIHRQSETSGILLERISRMIKQSDSLEVFKPIVIIRLLNVLQNCHESQTGSLIILLVIDVIRNCRHLAALRMVVNLTCRKLEYLLTLPADEIKRQMSESNPRQIMQHIAENKLAMKKNKTILGLLSKLSAQIYSREQQQQQSAETDSDRRTISSSSYTVIVVAAEFDYVRDLKIDKRWYLDWLTEKKNRILESNKEGDTNETLSRITIEDVAEMNRDDESKKLILTSILKVYTTTVTDDDDNDVSSEKSNKSGPLLQLSVEAVLNDIAIFLKTHWKYRRHRGQMQRIHDLERQEPSEEYSLRDVSDRDDDDARRHNLIGIVKGVTARFSTINRQLRDEYVSLNRSLLVSFGVVCFESIANVAVDRSAAINVDHAGEVIEYVEKMLSVPELTFVLTLRSHLTWLCTIVESVYRLLINFCVSSVIDDGTMTNAKQAKRISKDAGGRQTLKEKMQRANRQLEAAFIMVTTIKTTNLKGAGSRRRVVVPRSLYANVTSIVIRLSKMPPFKSYLLTPTNLWKGTRRPAALTSASAATEQDEVYGGTVTNQTISEESLPSPPPPPLPVDFLKDFDILVEYNFRITQLGWTDRKDFEETWMSLLSILNSCLIEDKNGGGCSSSFSSTCITVIKAVTALLGRTLHDGTTPNNGAVNETAAFFHVSRDLPVRTAGDVSLRNLKIVQDKFEALLKMEGSNYGNCTATTNANIVTNVFNKPNVEKTMLDAASPPSYSCGQISVAYLVLTLRKCTIENAAVEEDEEEEEYKCPLTKIYNERRTREWSSLDLNSCIQSLLDLYSQWLRNNKLENVSVALRTDGGSSILNEMLKSISVVSDLFQHRSQFCWMLDTYVELTNHSLLHHHHHHQQQQQQSSTEDDIISNRYLIVGICKAAAILNPDMEIYELIKRILHHNMKSANIAIRLSCFYGLLYLLEGCLLMNTVIGGLSDELQLVLSVAIQHIDYYNGNKDVIDSSSSSSSNNNNSNNSNNDESLDISVWALTFYIIENIHNDLLPSGFIHTTIQSLLTDLKVVITATTTQTTTNPVNYSSYSSLMKAVERLVLKRCLSSELREQILNLALYNVKNGNMLQSFLAIQLMITCMYVGDGHGESGKTSTLRTKDHRSSRMEPDENPDQLVRTIEKISVIFERIRRGLPFQVEILCRILPDIIDDFFSPADILTKVVGEFLSPQQKYPALLSRVLFEVFGNGIERSQLSLLQDWVLISLSNFTQTLSTGTAVWYLTCFFISTSDNFWLRSVFAYIRTRFGGRLEREDREMLCIAGHDFYTRLASDKQRRIFIDTFRRAAEDDRRLPEESLPFRELLDVCLLSSSSSSSS